MKRKTMKESNPHAPNTPNKRYSIAANGILLAWFFLDMIGIYFSDSYLVTRSWKEDGIFFVIFLMAFVFYILKEKAGKYFLLIWLFLWSVTQFFSHEWFTIMGNGEGKIRYFKDAVKWIECETRYVPDLYHTILHILIAAALVTTATFCIRGKLFRR